MTRLALIEQMWYTFLIQIKKETFVCSWFKRSEIGILLEHIEGWNPMMGHVRGWSYTPKLLKPSPVFLRGGIYM